MEPGTARTATVVVRKGVNGGGSRSSMREKGGGREKHTTPGAPKLTSTLSHTPKLTPTFGPVNGRPVFHVDPAQLCMPAALEGGWTHVD